MNLADERRRATDDHPSALAGLRVLELADEKGAYCGKMLAQMGADVIKVEMPVGCTTRSIPPFWKDEPHPDHSLYFLYMNTDKRSVTLDVHRKEGQDLFRQLAGAADVIVETFTPGYLDRLGLGYEALRKSNPGLIVTSITGFGQTGPYRHYKSCDVVAQALGAGMDSMRTMMPEGPPVKLASGQAHIVASVHGAAATSIALFHKRRTGEGQHIDVSMEEAMVSANHNVGVSVWLASGVVLKRLPVAPCGVFRCRDGRVYIMINMAAHWKAFAKWINEVTGIEEVLDPMFEGPTAVRLPYMDLLNYYVTEFAARFTVSEMFLEGQRRHITITPVNTAKAISEDAHMAAREFFVAREHALVGEVTYPGAPYRFTETPWRFERTAPQLGQHNEEVYCQELGVPPAAMAEYREQGVI